MPTAILVDGGFFVRRYRRIQPTTQHLDGPQAAKSLFTWCLKHLEDRDGGRRHLYRIFFYDCPPLSKKAHHPITKRSIDFAQSPEAQFRNELHVQLRQLRKVALRLGRLSDATHWTIKPGVTKELLSGKKTLSELAPEDLSYEARQKGVDMKIGLDIASLAFKRQVDQIVLLAGDADFVPAAKLARREGIDFVLDPMWQAVPDDLHEHIDGLRSTCPKPPDPPGTSKPAE